MRVRIDYEGHRSSPLGLYLQAQQTRMSIFLANHIVKGIRPCEPAL
jgi:hypothetical protein